MISYIKAIEIALKEALDEISEFKVFALGADYPNGVDGSHGSLPTTYPGRFIDTPASESTVTGMAFGRSLRGSPSLVHHGRVEFALFAADQIFTQAAKWNFQYGGATTAPLTIRIAIGRQWGNGPQHTSSLLQLFSAVPGLEVYVASSPKFAHALLSRAIRSKQPSIFIEPRWLYKVEQSFDVDSQVTDDSSAVKILDGSGASVLTYGEGLLETLHALQEVSLSDIAVWDYQAIHKPLGQDVLENIRLTRECLIVDPYASTGGPMAEAALQLQEMGVKVRILRPPHQHVPTAPSIAQNYYVTRIDIAAELSKILNQSATLRSLNFAELHLPPATKLTSSWAVQK